MDEYSANAGSPDEFDALLSRCSRLYYSGEIRLGLEICTEGVRRARTLGDRSSLRKMLTAHGVFQSDLHNLPHALQDFSEALDLCKHLDEPSFMFSVWNNISAALAYAEVPLLAVSAARTAAQYADRVASHDKRRLYRSMASINLAYGCLLANEYALGLRSARLACELLDPPGDSARLYEPELPHCLLALVTKARLLLRVKMLDEANACLAKAKGLARDAAALPRITLVVEMACALADTFCGKFDQGVARLTEVASSKQTPSPVVVVDALQFLIEAHVAANRLDLAAKHMRKLARYMQRVRSEDALFHHRRHAGWVASIGQVGVPNEVLSPMERHLFNVPRNERPTLEASQVLEDLCAAAELHDDPSGMHPHRVAELARLLALRTGVEEEESDRIALAAKLHDVGKVGIPPAILRKRGPLDAGEIEIMRWHTTSGAELLTSAHIEDSELAVAVARHHHEWWSGAGYPDGLANEAIPIAARIAALAEAFDAMTHDRPYRPRLSVASALDAIEDRAGRQFDPELAVTFCALVRELQRTHGNLNRHLERNAKHSGFLQAKQRFTDGIARAGSLRAQY